jgi:hypothetical protein
VVPDEEEDVYPLVVRVEELRFLFTDISCVGFFFRRLDRCKRSEEITVTRHKTMDAAVARSFSHPSKYCRLSNLPLAKFASKVSFNGRLTS